MATTLRLGEELDERLRRVAQHDGTSLQQASVTASSEYVERREAAIARSVFERIAERDAGLLDRLGHA